MSAPNSSRASPIIAAIRLALPATSPTGKSNWAMAMRRVSVMRVDPCVGSPASMDPRARPPPASQRLPRPTAGLPLPPLAGGGWEGGTLRSHRRPACPPPNPPPPAGGGGGGGGHPPEPSAHRLPPPQPSPASGGGSRAWRRSDPDLAPAGPNLAAVGAGSGSGNKGPRRPRPTACPSPRLRGEAGRGAPSGAIEMTCPHSAPRPFQPPQDRLAHRFRIPQDLVVPEPHHLEPRGTQKRIADRIAARAGVLAAIHFHHQPGLQAGKVGDVRPDRHLAPEPVSGQLAHAQA